jgi:hypothetical protein
MFVTTGNTFNTGGNWMGGEAIIRLQAGPLWTGQPTDYWAPTNWFSLDNSDTDLGGVSATVIDVPGATPSQLVLALGKDSNAYLLNRNNLGGITAPVTQANVGGINRGTSAVTYRTSQGTYFVFHNDENTIRAYKITATNPPTIAFAWSMSQSGRGSPWVTTTDGTSNFIVWVAGVAGDQQLHGYDGDTGAVIYAGGGANELMTGTRQWNTGMVARGRIYFGADNKVYAFQLPAGTPTPTPTPTATPTATATATATFTATATATAAATATFTPTPEPTATATFTPTPTATATFTPTPEPTSTPTATASAAATSTPTATATAKATSTPTATPTATATPGCQFTTSITSNFNGVPIQSGNYIWFNGVLKPDHLGRSPVTISFTQQTITSANFTLFVPDASVTFDPNVNFATTTFSGGMWLTTVPSPPLKGNTFFSALGYLVPANLPGGIRNVTWSGTISTATPGVSVKWQWAAAVYTNFSAYYNFLGVKPVDDNKKNPYLNKDRAGTPENFTPYVIGGATGSGGNNYTGSLGPTKGVGPCRP